MEAFGAECVQADFDPQAFCCVIAAKVYNIGAVITRYANSSNRPCIIAFEGKDGCLRLPTIRRVNRIRVARMMY